MSTAPSTTSSTDVQPTDALSRQGVAIWLDDLSRERLDTGGLAAMIAERDVVGVTTNPSIFQAAITGSDRYADDIAALAADGADAEAIVRALTTDDVRRACDLFTPVWEASARQDGRVSIEVDPRLAHDTEGTLAQARELWAEVDRPNLLVKVPATPAGLPAVRQLIAEGISVNVTLLFSLERYRETIDAYLAGLEDRLAAGQPLAEVTSVASFFVSRVDTEVDGRLDALGTPEAAAVRGTAAVANARLAYGAHLATLAGPRWKPLAAAGAHPQRPLWASTGVKDPAYPAARYVTELVAPGTVNTMPEATLDAVEAAPAVTGDAITPALDAARAELDALTGLGIDLTDVTDLLEAQGVQKFVDAWVQLLDAVAERT